MTYVWGQALVDSIVQYNRVQPLGSTNAPLTIFTAKGQCTVEEFLPKLLAAQRALLNSEILYVVTGFHGNQQGHFARFFQPRRVVKGTTNGEPIFSDGPVDNQYELRK